MNTNTNWKKRLDSAPTFEQFKGIVEGAIEQGSREELLALLAVLYAEFIARDPIGGAFGTLEAMRRVHGRLAPTDLELSRVEITPANLSAYLFQEKIVLQEVMV